MLQRLSCSYLADEIRGTYRGMMIAIGRAEWEAAFARLSCTAMSAALQELARRVRGSRYEKSTSG